MRDYHNQEFLLVSVEFCIGSPFLCRFLPPFQKHTSMWIDHAWSYVWMFSLERKCQRSQYRLRIRQDPDQDWKSRYWEWKEDVSAGFSVLRKDTKPVYWKRTYSGSIMASVGLCQRITWLLKAVPQIHSNTMRHDKRMSHKSCCAFSHTNYVSDAEPEKLWRSSRRT